MNIYDFDNTILKGDSSQKFIRYSLIRHPFIVTFSIILALKETIKRMFKKSNFDKVKSELFSFVKYIDNFDIYMDAFISKNMKHVKKFYLDNKKDDDVIISASFDFIIVPFCKKIGINNIIATKYDIKKGCIVGKNCKGEEKVKRLNELYKNYKVNEAYSDSYSDIPMLKLAKKAYLVKDEILIKLNLDK